MNATKRKFNALLQGIGTRPTTAVSEDKNEASRTSFSSLARPASSYSVSGSITNDLSSNTSTAPAAATSTDTMFTKPVLSSTATTTAPASTAPRTAAAELEFLAKRRKIGLGGPPSTSATLKSTSGNGGLTTSVSGSTLRKWGTGSVLQRQTPAAQQTLQQNQEAPAPRYCPGDRQQLLRRLATFQELTDWTPKPDRINEIEWAKRGWVCQGKERVRCTLCSKEVVVRLSRQEENGKEVPVLAPLPDSKATEAALVDRYAELVVAAHQEDCPWQKMGCDDTLLRLVLANPRYALEALRERYDELCARKDFLPYEFNLRLPAGLDIDAVLKTLPPTFFDPKPAASTTATTPTASQPNRVALALAVMGWQGLTNSRIGAVPNSASCQACLRRLGLWMFKSKQVDLETNTILEAAPMDCLDGVREHRFFCPWKNGAVQRNPGGGSGSRRKSTEADVPGWAVLVQVLKNDDYLRNRLAGSTPRREAATVRTAPADDAAPAGAGAAAEAETQPPSTPVRRPATAADAGVLGGDAFGEEDEVEDEATRAAKDKERWARLRRVKSLFDPKGSRRLKRGESRPGTAKSTKSTLLRPQSKGP